MQNRIFFTMLLAAGVLSACSSSKKFRTAVTEDQPLYSTINQLQKRPNDVKAKEELKVLYEKATQRHLQNMEAYRTGGSDLARWDKVLYEGNALQQIYTSLQATPGSFDVVEPQNYLSQLESIKEQAAEEYYQAALDLLNQDNREQSLQAYSMLQKINNYRPGYKDSKDLQLQAYEAGTVDVVINPITEARKLSLASWAKMNGAQPDDYQQTLVTDLGGTTATRYPARFFTDADARRQSLQADWQVNMTWSYLKATRTDPHLTTRKVSRKVETGKDSTGKKLYTTATATLHITEQTYSIEGNLDFVIDNLHDSIDIDHTVISDNIVWTESMGTYSGDKRALDDNDLQIIERKTLPQPSRAELVNSLMQKMYPRLRQRIETAVK